MVASGFFYEEGLYNFYNDRQHSGGRLFSRYRFLEASSFLVEDAGFAELYYGFGNEFWAGDDRSTGQQAVRGPGGPVPPEHPLSRSGTRSAAS